MQKVLFCKIKDRHFIVFIKIPPPVCETEGGEKRYVALLDVFFGSYSKSRISTAAQPTIQMKVQMYRSTRAFPCINSSGSGSSGVMVAKTQVMVAKIQDAFRYTREYQCVIRRSLFMAERSRNA
ncbi:MAG: hypothetical protein UT02_C0039G0002 [Parcubacteria group bacterium GW2011_GWC2_38_7]|nr:MAG: hypothetical protein UT02_C0039G0002 [Parcubacteria group bacterium GW2011_GWC2_38_7]